MTPDESVYRELIRQVRMTEVPEVEATKIDDALREYFSGKRDALRTPTLLDVEVTGRYGTFKGVVVDISRSGLLLRIMDSTFADSDELDHLMPYTARVWYQFEEGLTVRFAETDVEVSAFVVRVTGYAGRGQHLILIGCRFREALSEDRCELLGVEYSSDRLPDP